MCGPSQLTNIVTGYLAVGGVTALVVASMTYGIGLVSVALPITVLKAATVFLGAAIVVPIAVAVCNRSSSQPALLPQPAPPPPVAGARDATTLH